LPLAYTKTQWRVQRRQVCNRLAEIRTYRGDSNRAFDYLDEARLRILDQMTEVPVSPHLQLTLSSLFLISLHDDPLWVGWLDFVGPPAS